MIVRVYCTCIPSYTHNCKDNFIIQVYRRGPISGTTPSTSDQESKHTTQIFITFGNLSSDTNFYSSTSSVVV